MALGWGLLVLLVLLLLAQKMLAGLELRSSILDLLPDAEHSYLQSQAIEKYGDSFSRKVFFLLSSEDRSLARQQAIQLAQQLRQSGHFSQLTDRVDDLAVDNFRALYDYRQGLLSPRDQKALQAGNSEAIFRGLMAELQAPSSMLSAALLEADPLLTYMHFLSQRQRQDRFQFDDGLLHSEWGGRHYLLLVATLGDKPFSMAAQQAYSNTLASVRQTLPAGVSLIAVGMVEHVIAATEQAKKEMSTIGLGSLVAVVLLFLSSFSALRPLFYSLLPILVGTAAALLVCLLVFGSVHLLTLVFGASLIGVSIDYSFHFFSEQLFHPEAARGGSSLRKIFPAISLGLLTSAVGYLSLALAPLPGLREMALFSVVGLTAAYLSVVCWFPLLPAGRYRSSWSPVKNLAAALLKFWQWHNRQRLPWLPLLLLLLVVYASASMRSSDNIRGLDSAPLELLERQQLFSDVSGLKPTSQFFVVAGDTMETLLQREEQLLLALQQQVNEGTLGGVQALSQQLPSQFAQQHNFQLLKKELVDSGAAESFMRELGMSAALIEAYLQSFRDPAYHPLTFLQWRQLGLANTLQAQWFSLPDGSYASVVQLFDVTDLQALAAVAGPLDGVEWLDQVADISGLMKVYRQLANSLILLAYVFIYLLLVYRYGFRKALRLIFPPAMAAAVALATAALLGWPLSLFNSLALLLVLGIGIDYSIFFAELDRQQLSSGEHLPTMFAILLSALTTILAFGLLSLSATPALASIGITVLSGIFIAFLLSPMAIDQSK